MGILRIPWLQWGESCSILNEEQGQVEFKKDTPTLGSIVVNGKFPVGTIDSVAAEKNVDLPTFAFPKSPICTLFVKIIDLLVLQKQLKQKIKRLMCL